MQKEKELQNVLLRDAYYVQQTHRSDGRFCCSEQIGGATEIINIIWLGRRSGGEQQIGS